ncbi:unnamed protein product [Ceratitis capitata]|uniref:(Mediterranean fruit fly) hypothetical protein n=1 Tax=Ceratitis capitata TaxID=7213 RepID=A0A811V722_CERCA|nr:unnamed protein product [Ceratitis capitata]
MKKILLEHRTENGGARDAGASKPTSKEEDCWLGSSVSISEKPLLEKLCCKSNNLNTYFNEGYGPGDTDVDENAPGTSTVAVAQDEPHSSN